MAGVCVEETGFRRESAHCLSFEESAGCEDAERPEAHSRAEPGNEENTARKMVLRGNVNKRGRTSDYKYICYSCVILSRNAFENHRVSGKCLMVGEEPRSL